MIEGHEAAPRLGLDLREVRLAEVALVGRSGREAAVDQRERQRRRSVVVHELAAHGERRLGRDPPGDGRRHEEALAVDEVDERAVRLVGRVDARGDDAGEDLAVAADFRAVEVVAPDLLLQAEPGVEARRAGHVVDRAPGLATPVEDRGRSLQHLDALEVRHVGRSFEGELREARELSGAESILEETLLREAAKEVGLADAGARSPTLHAAHVLDRLEGIDDGAVLDRLRRDDHDRARSVEDLLGKPSGRPRFFRRITVIGALPLSLHGGGADHHAVARAGLVIRARRRREGEDQRKEGEQRRAHRRGHREFSPCRPQQSPADHRNWRGERDPREGIPDTVPDERGDEARQARETDHERDAVDLANGEFHPAARAAGSSRSSSLCSSSRNRSSTRRRPRASQR